MRYVKICLIVLLLGILCGCREQVDRQVEPEFVLTYAENQAEDYPTTQGGYQFAKLVEERTGGKIKVQVIANAELGNQQQVIDQMQFGGIDFARVSISSVSDEIPQLNVLQLPFLYDDAEHMWEVLDGKIGDEIMALFSQLDLVGLSWYEAGARNFYSSKRAIDSKEALAGLTVRVQESDMMKDMVSLLGGTPITLAYSDVYSAFETGKIDVAENNWPAYQSSKHYEVARYVTVDEHTRVPEVQLISGKTWEKLSEEYKEIVMQCAVESSDYERNLWKETEESARRLARKKGCQEIQFSSALLKEMRVAMAPLYKKYCANYMDLIEEIQSLRK